MFSRSVFCATRRPPSGRPLGVGRVVLDGSALTVGLGVLRVRNTCRCLTWCLGARARRGGSFVCEDPRTALRLDVVPVEQGVPRRRSTRSLFLSSSFIGVSF